MIMNKTVLPFIVIIIIFNTIILFWISDQYLNALWALFWDLFLQYGAEVPRRTHIIKENVVSDILHHSIYQLFERTEEKPLTRPSSSHCDKL